MKKNIKDYSLEELKNEFEILGEKKYRAEQVYNWIYKENVASFEKMTNLPLDLRQKIEKIYSLCCYNIIKKQISNDGTIKYLFNVGDGNAIETVRMEYKHGITLCVSSQIGCKMGCKFCASTRNSFY